LVLAAVLVEPAIHFLLGLLAAPAVSLLDLADQLLDVALHLVDIVIRELAPLLTDLALDLRPLALQDFAVHCSLLPSHCLVLARQGGPPARRPTLPAWKRPTVRRPRGPCREGAGGSPGLP